jgi:hypothetical protein
MKTFKQKAVYAALAGVTFLSAGVANAVNTNPEGLGEALIYPYYTTRNGASTLVSVVNTTDAPKAVKVRILEGKNSREVLDFNLFLSPKDVWTASITTPEGATGARLDTSDRSCVYPEIIRASGYAFVNYAFAGDSDASLDRTREGYIEIIEMASIRTGSAVGDDVTHNAAGQPSCKLISDIALKSTFEDYDLPTGGLFGAGTLISAGMSTGYNATALQGLGYTDGVTSAGSTNPTLNSGQNKVAVVVDSPASSTTRITAAAFNRPIDAVSATIMADEAYGEYSYTALNSGLTFSNDWVLTFPTKRLYVNPTVVAPFQRAWDTATSRACHDITIHSYDREEGSGTSEDLPSPLPPTGKNGLCYESTVVSMGGLKDSASRVLASKNAIGITPYQSKPASGGGWATLRFDASVTPTLGALGSSQQTTVTSGIIAPQTTGAVTFHGLPVVGFSVSEAKFANASASFNSSYSLSFKRKITQQ